MSLQQQITTFEDLDTIQKHIFVTDTTENALGCYSLWDIHDGQRKSRTECIVEAWKNAWDDNEDKNKNIYYVELDMSGYAVNDDVALTNWIIWFDLIEKLSKMVKLNEIKECEFEKMKIESIYRYFTSKLKPEDVNMSNTVKTQNNMDYLFKYYTKLNIHVIVVMKNFEACRELFPKDKDTRFFRTMFGLSPKGSPAPFKLTILTCSKSHIAEIVHHDNDISPVESAYPDGVVGGGNLAQYSEEDFEAYLKSLTE